MDNQTRVLFIFTVGCLVLFILSIFIPLSEGYHMGSLNDADTPRVFELQTEDECVDQCVERCKEDT